MFNDVMTLSGYIRARRSSATLLKALALALVFALIAAGGIALTRESSRIAALWLPNAILLAVILRSHRPTRFDYLVFCAIANVAANYLIGDPLSTALLLASINLAEVVAACLILRWLGAEILDMGRLEHLGKLAFAGIVAPMFSGTLAAIALSGPDDFLSRAVWLSWVASDGLGLMIVTPVVMIGIDAWRARRKPRPGEVSEWLLFILGASSVNIAVFAQTRYPFLFLVCPIAIIAAFRTGILGTAVAVTIISIVASVATMLGYGPIMLVRGDLPSRLVVLQLFLASTFLMALPVAAALASRAAMRRELQESRDFAELILENMGEVVFRADAEGRWIFLNPAWEQLTGYTVSESLGWLTTRLLHQEDFAKAQEIYPGIVSGALREIQLAQRFTNADGETRHIVASVRRLADAEGNFIGTTGNIRDVTSQLLAEEQLRASEERFRLLAEAAPVGIFQVTAAGKLSYTNSAWNRMSGLTLEEARENGWMRAMSAEEGRNLANAWAEAFHSGCDFRGEARWRHADGTSTWIDMLARPVFNADHALMGYIGVSVDITDRKTLEFELQEARRTAEAAAQAKTVFLANMSHELRTPMNGVLGFTDLLLSERLTERQHRHAQLIADSGRAMMRLLNDILDISKIESGQMQLSRDPLNFRHKLAGCIDLVNPLAAQKGVEISLHVADSVPPLIMGDALRLRQVLLNLLGNATKFTHEGRISVSASIVGDDGDRWLRIDVADTGIGIPEDRTGAIFESFAQADTATARKYGGSGLGLAISHNLVALMQGSLTVESQENVGTTFTVRLPLHEAEPGAAEIEDEAEPVESGVVRARILVAEDNDINQALIRSMAERLGLEIDIAENGEEAIALILDRPPDAPAYDMVLMDMQMPVIDGLEATRRLRAAGISAEQLPIVALTANAYAEDIEACQKAGMQAHLAKPITMRALRRMVEKWVGVETDGSGRDAAGASDSLQGRYLQRKRDLFARIEDALGSQSITSEALGEITIQLHKLAGTAGIFGEDRLGEIASQIEHAMRAHPDRAAHILSERFEALKRAGQDV
ncbi:hypothetical protein GCM10011329_19610 [Stakelama pacifica]|nr:hypothetical protein GCM10011329_19610 [Stakelama pacifica]